MGVDVVVSFDGVVDDDGSVEVVVVVEVNAGVAGEVTHSEVDGCVVVGGSRHGYYV